MNKVTTVEALVTYLRKKWIRPQLQSRPGRGAALNRYYIFDPLFIVRQRQSKVQDRGRRTTGVYVDFLENGTALIGIRTEFCRQNFLDFLANTTSAQVHSVARKLIKVKGGKLALVWSSKLVAKATAKKKHINFIMPETSSEYGEFLRLTVGNMDILSDVGVVMPNTYKNARTATKDRGTLFELSVELKRPTLNDLKKIADIVKPLFLNFYPSQVEQSRNSGLRGKLTTFYKKNGLEFECAYLGCSVTGLQKLQAAHIKAHIKGGIDQPKNGVYLCHQHHLIQGPLSPKDQKKILKRKFIKHTVLVP